MNLSSVIWIAIVVLGCVALVLIVRRSSAVTPEKLGFMSGEWIAEHRAGQQDDPTH
jgi:hypothetical protein